MAISRWWESDPGQRYWMEITDREDLGADLLAPKVRSDGKPYWGFELITHVEPGDVVYHWHSKLLDEPGIVGWSQAVGGWEDTHMRWESHVAAVHGSASLQPAWRVPLENYIAMTQPLLISEVREREGELRALQAQLQEKFQSRTLYFPFQFSATRSLRASQTYFVKVPREVVELLGLPAAPTPQLPPTPRDAGALAPKRAGSGFMADAAVRSAVEWHAVAIATELYETGGYTVEYTGANKPYDLVAVREDEHRRVEVKGSTGTAESVQLTRGEVRNSHDHSPTDLIVVDQIKWKRSADGSVETEGGRTRSWMDWSASEGQLTPLAFRYDLPSQA